MKIRDISLDHSLSVNRLTMLEACARVMREKELDAIAVVEGRRLAGMVGLRDLVYKSLATGDDPWFMRISDVMNEDAPTCRLDEEVEAVLARMEDRCPWAAVLDEEGAFAGTVTKGRLVDALAGDAGKRDDPQITLELRA